MKKTLILISLALLSISCNDDDVAPTLEKGDALLTRISKDGITQIELSYDLDERLHRVDIYTSGKYSGFNLYEYNGINLEELKRYDTDDHTLKLRTVFTHDNFGRVIKGENCAAPSFSTDQIATFTEFEFNNSGQLTAKQSGFYAQPASSREEYTYDDKNNLVGTRRILYPNEEGEYLAFELFYAPAEQSIPDHWKNYVFILGLTSFDDPVFEMFNVSLRQKIWSVNHTPTGEYILESSGHVFDADGNLARQIITKRNVLHPEVPDEEYEMSYDYRQGN